MAAAFDRMVHAAGLLLGRRPAGRTAPSHHRCPGSLSPTDRHPSLLPPADARSPSTSFARMLVAPLLSAAALGLASVQQAAAYPLYIRTNIAPEPVHPDAATNGTAGALNASALFNTRDGFAVLGHNFSQLVLVRRLRLTPAWRPSSKGKSGPPSREGTGKEGRLGTCTDQLFFSWLHPLRSSATRYPTTELASPRSPTAQSLTRSTTTTLASASESVLVPSTNRLRGLASQPRLSLG